MCPECGSALALGVRGSGGLGRRAGLLLLVLGWLVLAGALHAYTVGRSIYATVTLMPQVLTVSTPIQAGGLFAPPATGASPAWPPTAPSNAPTPSVGTTILIPPPGGSITSGSTTLRAQQMQIFLAPAARSGSGWSAVSWRHWIEAAWWPALGLAALAAMITVVAHRRRAIAPRLDRAVTMTAWLGMAGYAAFEVLAFAGF
jgi:hypothetical protein